MFIFNGKFIYREESSSPVLEEEASIEIIDDDQAEPAAIVVEDEEVGIFFRDKDPDPVIFGGTFFNGSGSYL